LHVCAIRFAFGFSLFPRDLFFFQSLLFLDFLKNFFLVWKQIWYSRIFFQLCSPCRILLGKFSVFSLF